VEERRFSRLLKNSLGVSVLKGRRFKPRRKYSKINRGFSRWGRFPAAEGVFQQRKRTLG
jgi:hypothetical protein